jgi:hypothetical protein
MGVFLRQKMGIFLRQKKGIFLLHLREGISLSLMFNFPSTACGRGGRGEGVSALAFLSVGFLSLRTWRS